MRSTPAKDSAKLITNKVHARAKHSSITIVVAVVSLYRVHVSERYTVNAITMTHLKVLDVRAVFLMLTVDTTWH